MVKPIECQSYNQYEFVNFTEVMNVLDAGCSAVEAARDLVKKASDVLDENDKQDDEISVMIKDAKEQIVSNTAAMTEHADKMNRHFIEMQIKMDENREILNEIAKSQDEIAKSQDEIAKSQDEIAKSQDRMSITLDSIEERNKGVLEFIDKEDCCNNDDIIYPNKEQSILDVVCGKLSYAITACINFVRRIF